MNILIVLIFIGVIHGAVIPTPNIISNAPSENLSGTTSPTESGGDDGLQRPSRSPFSWDIHGSPLTLLFSSYGKNVHDEDIISCYTAAKRYIRDVVRTHGDGPIPPSLQLHWTHRSAVLSIQHSPRMTYGILADFFIGIETFQLSYNYFEVHFEIILQATGIIGSGDISRFIGSTSANNNSITPAPLPETEGTISPALILPPAAGKIQLPAPPFIWPQNDTPVKITFTAYGIRLNETDILTCYVAAANYVLQTIQVHGDIQIAPNVILHWTHGTASLTVQHRPRMRFGDLSDVVAALESFQSRYGFTEAAFYFSSSDGQRGGILGAGSVGSRNAEVLNSTTTSSNPWMLSIPKANATATVPPNSDPTTNDATLPPDPTTIRPLPESRLYLTFTHYGRVLPPEDLLEAWLLLTQRVTTELLRGKRDDTMLEALDVKYRHALMVVSPTEETEKMMTWGKLAVALQGITKFLSGEGAWLSCDFIVGEYGRGMIGNGFVMYV
ncbi:MAG: hypothetical protein Q9206_002541 [Seirophora lacunosa]